ncbi:GAD-like domain-containing protein [Marivita sp. S0852]|uniref:GAD-like domain-containing protein n=1 Tax=Marivita sp. S0852 TaxID=3373893 RepID=UPI003982D10C
MLRDIGPPQTEGVRQPDAAVFEAYRGRVPDELIRFWHAHGWGSWRDGLFWLCDPRPFEPMLQTLFADDPEFASADIVIYLRDAFGGVIGWHPKLKLVNLNMHWGKVTTTDITVQEIDGKHLFNDDHAVASGVATRAIRDEGWLGDESGGPVFDELRARLGPITEDQVYTMAPHVRLGGAGEPDDFSIGGLVEYMGFLAQLGPFTLMRYVDPKEGGRGPYGHSEPVRTIGHSTLIEE